jgi:predicted Rossmann fold nucleotide-binding protein DprA/Smf involved in DNA uptake
MGWAPVGVDMLAERLQCTPGSLASVLLQLELAGLIERLDDGSLARRKSA